MIWWIPAGYAVFLALVIYRYSTRRPRLADHPAQRAGSLASVIVPARNEAMNIERCVRSILATEYRPVEVIVVDDRSSDATAEIVERLTRSGEAAGRLRLVRGEELPEGWFGKPWAIAQGYRVARGDLLLFTDADTWHHPELLPRTATVLTAERADLVSVVARQEMVTFWERLVQPHVLVALASRVGDLRRVNRTRVTWDAIASGAYILTTRRAYDAVGTHQSVKGSVAEDLALAQAYVRHHLDIFLTHGEQFMSVRMYRSLAEIVEGWSKKPGAGRAADVSTAPVRPARRALLDVATGALLGAPAAALGGVRLELGGGHDPRVARDMDRGVPGGGGAGALRAAVSARGRHGGVYHDQVGMAGRERQMERQDLHKLDAQTHRGEQ